MKGWRDPVREGDRHISPYISIFIYMYMNIWRERNRKREQ